MSELVLEPIHHVYKLGDRVLPGITEIIRSAGLVDSAWFTDFSRERGSAAHLACQLYDEDDLDETSLDPVIIPYLEAWKKFRTDTGFVPGFIERSLHSPVYGFAGTPDRAGKLNGYTAVIEIKTGAISAVTGLQLAAQEMLFIENGLCVPDKRFAVQLKNDGSYKLTAFIDPMDQAIFLSSLVIHTFKKEHKINGGN